MAKKFHREVNKLENLHTANEIQINTKLSLPSIPSLLKHRQCRLPKRDGMENQKQSIIVTQPNVLLKLPGIEKAYVVYFFLAKIPQR